MNKWQVEIPYEIVSHNRLLRMHYRTRMREFDKARDLIWAYGRPLAEFDGKVNLQITRLWGHRQRAMDLDNLYASCKLLIDALKKPKGRFKKGLSVILDDDPSHVVLKVNQEKSADGEKKVRIEIWPAD